MTLWPIPLPPAPELYTVHDSTAEKVAGLVYPKTPWVIRRNGKLRTILSPRYGTEAEADCAACGLNSAATSQSVDSKPDQLRLTAFP